MFVPGQPSLPTAAYETLSMPSVMLAIAAAVFLYSQPTKAKQLAKKSAGSCQSAYCGAVEMFVDKPMNTLLKDQSLGAGLRRPQSLPMPANVYSKLQSDFMREQLASPGVNLVAHTVA